MSNQDARKFKRFQRILEEYAKLAENDKIPTLFFCHTATQGRFYNIRERKKILLDKYEPYKDEEAALFSYGIPYYRLPIGSNIDQNPPISFLFKLETLRKYRPKRVSTFDPSSFHSYTISEGYTLDNFIYDFPRSIHITKGFVRLMYRTIQDYLEGRLAEDHLDNMSGQCELLKELSRMYGYKYKNDFGYPTFSIELQYGDRIDFKPSHIVLPFNLNTSKEWVEEHFRKDFPGTEIIYYGEERIRETKGNLDSKDYHQLMSERIRKLMIKMTQSAA